MYKWNNEKNLTSDAIRKSIADNELREYGQGRELLSDRLDAATAAGVVCGLYNSDSRGVLLPLLKDNPEKIMKGICYAAIAAEADEAFLYIPEYANETAESLADICEKYNVKLERGIVDVRERKGCLMMHIATAADLTDVIDGDYKQGIYVSADGKAPEKVSSDTPVDKLIDVNNAKAVICGMHILTPEDASMSIDEAAPEDGYLRAVGESECLMQTLSSQLEASDKQSCGKCVFCREGLIQLRFMHKEMTLGRGKAEHMDLIKEIGEGMCISSPCTVGQQSAIAALDAIEKFESIYKEHIKKKCSVCFNEEFIYIDPKLCQGCEECVDVCPKDCIEGKAKFIHMIDEFDCDLCGKCIEVCEYDAIVKTSGKLPKLPNRLTKVGKFRR